jgi:hypothetical protein
VRARVKRPSFTPERCVEWFVVANVGFLGLDIAVAHAENRYARPAEWVPLVFSGVATALLLPMAFGARARAWRALEILVASGCIVVGVLGMVFHLESAFFQEQTLANLVYSAPFVAPLAYVGVGLLLLLIRMEPAGSREVAWWILLLALGGFGGNLVLSLLDHAQNGFFRWTEWIPVFAAAMAVGFLFVVWARPDEAIVRATFAVLGLQAAVGVLGFVLHAVADLGRSSSHLVDRFVFGAPAFAPLLFADLALLGAIGLWATRRAASARDAVR